MVLTRDSLLKIKRKTKAVELPELNGTVYVREVSEAEAFEFVKRQSSGDQNGAVLYLIARCVSKDDKGGRMFDDDHADQIGEMPASIANALLTAVLEVSGMAPEQTKKNAS